MAGSNIPPTWELLVVPDGMKKISMEMDTKIPNAATFTILKEDHTLGNTLRMQLLKNPQVIFAGYKVPHPLEHQFLLKIQTVPETTPLDVLHLELGHLMAEVANIKLKFENQMTLRVVNETEMGPEPSMMRMHRDF